MNFIRIALSCLLIIFCSTYATCSESDFKQKIGNRILWNGPRAQEEFIKCIRQQDPDCIKNIPVSSKAQVLQGDSLRAITKELASKPYLKNRIPMLQALTEKVGGIQEWYKRYHHNITSLNYPQLLECAIGCNDQQLVDFILESAIHPDAIKNPVGQTPLFEAIRFERLEMLKKLISRGADVTLQAEYLTTPLHYAAVMGVKKTEIIDELVRAGADINATDKFGEMPLHEAVALQCGVHTDSCINTIETLLKNGAWVDKSANKRKTPLSYAQNLEKEACEEKQKWIRKTGRWPWATDPCKKLQDTIAVMQQYVKNDEQ